MEEPLISVIIPIYKVEKYLKKCVDSAIQQTYTNLEIILVDDGSPDNCGVICDNYALIDSRIKVIHKENGGLADARNAAIDIATGDYLTFIDSDDYVSSDYVETLAELVKMGAEIAISGFIHDYESSSFHSSSIPSNKDDVLYSAEMATELMFYQHIENTAWGKLYQRDLFNGIRYPNLLYEDIPVTYKLMLRAKHIAVTYKATYFYLVRKESISCSSFSERKMEMLSITDEIISDVSSNYSDLMNAAQCRCVNALFYVMLQLPEYKGYEKPFMQRIKNLRWGVLTDKKARLKTKLGLLISYGGFNLTRYLFDFVNRRSF